MIDFTGISACLVTRGDVDMTTIINSLPFDDVVVWNNAEREDLKCYGRYAAVAEAKHEYIYTQDDDVLVPIPALVKAYNDEGRAFAVANVPPDEEWLWLGWGSIFHREDLDALDGYIDNYGKDEEFYEAADVALAYQLEIQRVWVGALGFPWESADNRMYKQPNHYDVRGRVRDQTLALSSDSL